MNYKVVILTAGVGKRIGSWGEVFNKALLPVNFKPVICQIIDKFPTDVEIILAVGYKKEQITTYLTTVYPHRKLAFVDVEKYTGEGSGPGYSLLKCKPHLQCPFIFYAVDTIVTDPVPEPSNNWYGVAEVKDTLRFCSCKVDEQNKIVRIDDKNKNDNTLAFIGLAGVHEYDIFWRSLEKNITLIGGELQVSNGFLGLMHSQSGMYAQTFTWLDTGTQEEYNRTKEYFKTRQF